MTKIMAVSLVPVLAIGLLLGTPNEGLSQDAKSIAVDAPHAEITLYGPHQAEQRTRDAARTPRDIERVKRIEQRRRARAKARAEARAEERAEARAAAEAQAATPAATREYSSGGSTGLPELLLTIRSHESGGNYNAYNASGCLGGCYGAYQMAGEYMDTWAANAGYPDYAYAGVWPPEVQDAVALWMYNQPNGAEFYWCQWTDYC